MAQQHWTIPGIYGQTYLIGMYHGEESGHLMVHCNNKVLLVDFGVKEPKTFPFFLDEELFELVIEKNNGRYAYQITHNGEIDSPRNRVMKELEREGKWRSKIMAIMMLVLAVMGAIIYLRQPDYDAQDRQKLAAGIGMPTEVSLYQQGNEWYIDYRTGKPFKVNPLLNRIRCSPGDFPCVKATVLRRVFCPNTKELFMFYGSNPERRL
ncbi:MAG: hypothetical protein R2795_25765 [Saprospiraceae bacterium]